MGAAGIASPDFTRSARAMGATIRALRGHAHISQIALGARLSMHPNYVGAIERGEILNPGLDTVDRIACALGVSVAVLADSYADASEESALPGGRHEHAVASYDAAALGEAIKAVRGRRGLTQQQLADLTGLHRNHLGSIEAGEKPIRGIATIARVASGLTAGCGGDEPSLLALFAQVFTGELTLAHVHDALASTPSGPSAARSHPPCGR